MVSQRNANRITTQVIAGSLVAVGVYFGGVMDTIPAPITIALTNLTTLAVQIIFSKFDILNKIKDIP